MKPTYFKNLDGLRCIAACIVFLSHGTRQAIIKAVDDNAIITKFLYVLMHGGIGVSIFFVLSGFLITYLIIFEKNTNGKISLGKFYLRRILRIWPLYYLVIGFGFIVYPAFKQYFDLPGVLDSNIYYHLAFLSNFDVIRMYQMGGLNAEASQEITWSVSIEEQFYLFWPLIFTLPKKIWVYFILAIISSYYFRFIHFDDKFITYYHTISVIGDLAWGALFAVLIAKVNGIKSFFEQTGTTFHILILLSTFTFLFFRDEIMTTPGFKYLFRDVLSFFFALTIASQAMTKNNSILNLSKFKMISRLGKYTYGIYLLHPIAILILHVLCHRIFKFDYSTNLPSALSFYLSSFGLTLVISILSYKYYESFFLKLKTRIANSYKQSTSS